MQVVYAAPSSNRTSRTDLQNVSACLHEVQSWHIDSRRSQNNNLTAQRALLCCTHSPLIPLPSQLEDLSTGQTYYQTNTYQLFNIYKRLRWGAPLLLRAVRCGRGCCPPPLLCAPLQADQLLIRIGAAQFQ